MEYRSTILKVRPLALAPVIAAHGRVHFLFEPELVISVELPGFFLADANNRNMQHPLMPDIRPDFSKKTNRFNRTVRTACPK